MSSDTLKRAKRELRVRTKALRDGLDPEDRVRDASRIVKRVLELPQVKAAGTVTVYLDFGSEIPTSELIAVLDAEGKRVAVPRVRGGEITMIRYRPGDPVAESSYGMMEPAGNEEIPPEEIDVLVTPAVAFDRSGRRLGYGGGFYDRYVRRTRPDALRVGVAYSAQLVEEVPNGSIDEPVDLVVTEDEMLAAPPRGGAST
jgi:5-formyltetrahydrofolate cyclo-ligase